MADPLPPVTAFGDARPGRPDHPDFARLVSAVLWMDGQRDPVGTVTSLGFDPDVASDAAMIRASSVLADYSDRIAQATDATADKTLVTVWVAAWVDGFADGVFLPDSSDGRDRDHPDQRRLEMAITKRTVNHDLTGLRALMGEPPIPPLGADTSSVSYTALQRALRIVSPPVTVADISRVPAVSALWIDGFTTGMRYTQEGPSLT